LDLLGILFGRRQSGLHYNIAGDILKKKQGEVLLNIPCQMSLIKGELFAEIS
jgi:hypothetical protein